MLENTSAIEAVFGTSGLIAFGFLMFKFFAKQGFGGLLDVKEMGARNDIIEDLRIEIRAVRTRVNDLEIKVSKLQDRLVVVRTHALTIYGIVQNSCKACNRGRDQEILDLLTAIIRED
jgi:hypothetical protein